VWKARRMTSKLRRLTGSGQIGGVGELDKIAEMFKKAQAFQKDTANGHEDPAPAAANFTNQAKAWEDRWKEVVLEGKAKDHGIVVGCEVRFGVPCPWRLKSMFILHRGLGVFAKRVNTVAMLSDTRHAVSCGDDKKCWVWEISTGAPRMIFPKHSGNVMAVVALNDAAYVVSGGFSDAEPLGEVGEAYVWQWLRGSTYVYGGWKQDALGGAVLSVAEIPFFRLVLMGLKSGDINLWNIASNKIVVLPWGARTYTELVGKYNTLVGNIQSVSNGWEWYAIQQAVHAQEAFWAVVEAKHPKLKWGETVYNFFHKNRMGAVNGISYVPTNLRFVTGHQDGRVRYWSAVSGQLLMVMRGHLGPVTCVGGLPQAQKAVSGGEDGTVRLWDLRTGMQLLLLWQPWGGPIRSLAMIPGGTKVAVGSHDGFIRIWDLNTGLMMCEINTWGGQVNGLAANPSNPLGQLIAANEDGYVRVYNPL